MVHPGTLGRIFSVVTEYYVKKSCFTKIDSHLSSASYHRTQGGAGEGGQNGNGVGSVILGGGSNDY